MRLPLGPVPVQMLLRQARSQSRSRCGRGEPRPRNCSGRGEPGPSADVVTPPYHTGGGSHAKPTQTGGSAVWSQPRRSPGVEPAKQSKAMQSRRGGSRHPIRMIPEGVRMQASSRALRASSSCGHMLVGVLCLCACLFGCALLCSSVRWFEGHSVALGSQSATPSSAPPSKNFTAAVPGCVAAGQRARNTQRCNNATYNTACETKAISAADTWAERRGSAWAAAAILACFGSTVGTKRTTRCCMLRGASCVVFDVDWWFSVPLLRAVAQCACGA
jgi:hypothetical protein